ncbi:MAG TPA: TolC family protein [Chitinophagaceae bacterium]|jgi:outer membrane protein TolC|nr:TolC family protein [Chitinophagaceae bacterium]
MKAILFSIALLLGGLPAVAQPALSLEEFLGVVRRYHPVARQAALGVEIAGAEVTSARGAFDPAFQNSISRKELDGLLYYDHQVTEVRIPTWYGVDVVAGIESLSGERTSTPDTKGNSSYLGFSVPVAKGLLLDARRAALQQAKIFRQLSVQEQRAVLNDLLFQASAAYWNWWQQVQVQRLFRQAIRNAEERFRLVRTAFLIGERPAIDTVEALAQWQGFQLRASELQLDITNAQLEVNVFLWQESGEAYALPPAVVPQTELPVLPEALQVDRLLEQSGAHPELEQYRFKLEALQVERRLKFQSLLPSVYLKYNQLNKSHQLQKALSTPWLENNYRYGLAISMPLRLSEGRGEYRKARLKIEQTRWQQLNKQIGLQAKIRQYHNEWRQLREQIVLQRQALQSYAALQRGEETKFANGESSLFLVNARQLKTLEAEQKLLELQSKEQKAAAGVLWAAGVLGNE